MNGLRSKEKHERRISICQQQRCTKCAASCAYVPKDCEFLILHVLADPDDLGRQVNMQGRRSGKTTEILRIAKIHAERGTQVIIVTPDHAHKETMRATLRREGIEGVKAVSLRNATEVRQLLCRRDTVVMTDEVQEREMQRLMSCCPIENYLGGFATPH